MHPHILYVPCVFAERQNHARELVREADLSQWDALVIMSGDGLLFEVQMAHSCSLFKCQMYQCINVNNINRWLLNNCGSIVVLFLFVRVG